MAFTPEQEAAILAMKEAFDNGQTVADLSAVTTLTEAEVMEIQQNGLSKKITLEILRKQFSENGIGGGTAQAQTVTLPGSIAAYTAGMKIFYIPSASNTGAAPTVNVNGKGAKTILLGANTVGGTALIAGDIAANIPCCLIYDGANFRLQNPQNRTAASVKVTPAGGIVSTNVQTALEEIDGEVSDLELIILGIPYIEKIADFNSEQEIGFFFGTDITSLSFWSERGNPTPVRKCFVIGIEEYAGGVMHITANNNLSARYLFTKKEMPTISAAGETIVSGNYLCDATQGGINVSAGESASVNIPITARYIYVNEEIDGSIYTPVSMSFRLDLGNGGLVGEISDINNSIAGINTKIEEWDDIDFMITAKVGYATPSITTNNTVGWWSKNGIVIKESAIINVYPYRGGLLKIKSNELNDSMLVFSTRELPYIENDYSGQALIAGGYLCDNSVSAVRVLANQEQEISIPSNAFYLYIRTLYGYLAATDYTPEYVFLLKNPDVEKLSETTHGIVMPNKVFMLNGSKMQIFKSSISMQYNPDMNMLDIKKGDNANVGTNRDTYFEYNVNSQNVNFKGRFGLYGDVIGYIYANNETEFIHINKASSPSSNKNILLIGDSFTAGYNYPNELRRLITGENQVNYADQSGIVSAGSLTNITFIGTRGTEYFQDSCKNEGYGGEDYLFFATNTRTNVNGTNPFWNPNNQQVDFDFYCTENSYSQIDIAVILLGTNGMHSVENITTVWNALLLHNPNIKVIIAGRCYACPYGIGYAVGMSQNQTWVNISKDVDSYNIMLQTMCDSEPYKNNFSYVDYRIQLDNRHNMVWSTGYANNRNHEVEIRLTGDNVHPNKYGYWQIADAIQPMIHKALNEIVP